MKILITAPYEKKCLDVLGDKFSEIAYHSWKPNGRAYKENELIKLIEGTNADALVTEHDKVTNKVIEKFPELKFIGVCRGTPSNVDIDTASKHDIPVFYTPARNAQAVAEMFFANVITLMRNILPAIEWLESESWKAGAHDSYLQFKGNELAGKTIGMVGFGAIGHRIAEMAKTYPCQINYYDPYIEGEYSNASPTSLEKVFSDSDIVSIHLPVNEETKGMIGASLIKLMRKDAIFVNTSRAIVVQREALLRALNENAIKGAVLDVFDSEPPDALDYELIHKEEVLATPHIAGATYEVENHHSKIMNRNLLNWFVKNNKVDICIANNEIIV